MCSLDTSNTCNNNNNNNNNNNVLNQFVAI